MATSFEQQPILLNGVRSPMVYTLKDSNVNNPGFQYVLDVFIWTGDTTTIPANYSYRLKKPPLANDLASFDVSSLVQSAIKILPKPYDINDVSTGGLSVYNVACKAGWVDATGGSDLQNSTSNITWASNGYYEYFSGLNQSIVDFNLSSKNKFLIRDDGNEIASTFYDSNLDVTLINYRSANNLYTLDLTNYYDITGTLNSPEKILYFPIGINNLTNYNNSVGPFPDLTAVLNEGLTSVGFRTSSFEYVKEVEILCEPKYQPITVYFVNSFGAWDFVNFMKRKDLRTTTTRKEYTTRASEYTGNVLGYDADEGQIRRYNVDGQEFITMSTGFVDEAMGASIQEMLVSENIIAWVNSVEPFQRALNIESTETTFKQGVNEKLINYTMTFKIAATLVNTM
jgi:hypothetical protein